LLDTTSIQKDKQRLRDEILSSGFPVTIDGKSAEKVRGLPCYRQVRQMFVSPEPALEQIRINCLIDGKKLIMPSPGLKQGFFLLTPFTIPFRDLGYAVSMKGFAKYGKKFDMSAVKELTVDLFVTTCLNVDKGGGQLGDGNGFFDLAYSLFSVQGGVAENAAVCTVVGEEQIDTGFLPLAPWDVKADFIVTRKEIISTSAEKRASVDIFWEILPEKRIRKITPLWQLYQRKNLT
jgi:5-formyltetrahydrofolate cyclo-ligase